MSLFFGVVNDEVSENLDTKACGLIVLGVPDWTSHVDVSPLGGGITDKLLEEESGSDGSSSLATTDVFNVTLLTLDPVFIFWMERKWPDKITYIRERKSILKNI